MHKRPHPLASTRLILLACLLAALVLLPLPGYGRAGGGGSYGGSGGGYVGGGGHGGGDGGVIIIYLLLRLVVTHPLIGVPAAAAAIALFYYSGKQTHSGHMTRVIRKGHGAQIQSRKDAALAGLLSRDPNFRQEAFVERVKHAFLKIQDAWSKQHLQQVRAFLSDGVFQRFSLQIDMQKAEGLRNRVENVHVETCRIVAIHSDKHFDTIHLMIQASAVDSMVSLKTQKRISGGTAPESFVEYWSFHRKIGVKTGSGPGAMEGTCPNCGSPLEIVDVAKCPACDSLVNSGAHDWVLAEITQAQEWRVPSADQRVPGLAKLKELDPGFSAQHIEDRVSVMFWKLRGMEFLNDSTQARPLVSDRFAGKMQEKIPSHRKAARDFWKDAAVGKVEIRNVQIGRQGDKDRIRVVIRWSGALHHGVPGEPSRQIRRQAIYTDVYVLIRNHGTQSIAARVFSSAECTQCGAPFTGATGARCEYCGTSLVDGKHDWVLDDIEPYNAHEVYQPMEQELASLIGVQDALPMPEIDGELMLSVLAHLMHADGHFDTREREILRAMATRRGITEQSLRTIIHTATMPDFHLPTPSDRRQGAYLLSQMVIASLADGHVSPKERQLLYRFAGTQNMSPLDVRMTIARERKKAYQQSKTILRQARKKDGNSRKPNATKPEET